MTLEEISSTVALDITDEMSVFVLRGTTELVVRYCRAVATAPNLKLPEVYQVGMY